MLPGKSQRNVRNLTPLRMTTEDVRKYAAELSIAGEEALEKGMEEKSREFTEKGSELYAKA